MPRTHFKTAFSNCGRGILQFSLEDRVSTFSTMKMAGLFLFALALLGICQNCAQGFRRTTVNPAPYSLAALAPIPQSCSFRDQDWMSMKGADVNLDEVTQDFLRDLRSHRATLIRLSFRHTPLIKKDGKNQINNEALQRLQEVVGWAKSLGMHVIIDPHTFPGFKRDTTTLPKDVFWTDKADQDLMVSAWGVVAKLMSSQFPTVIGYDILNEPSPPGTLAEAAAQWNALANRAIAEIRHYDHCTYAVVESPRLRISYKLSIPSIKTLSYLDVTDPSERIVISPHFYLPHEFAGQNIRGRPYGVKYPGTIADLMWDKQQIQDQLEDARDIQKAKHYLIFVGEFDTDVYAGDLGGDKYIEDVSSLFNQYGWSWCIEIYGAGPYDIRNDTDPAGNVTGQRRWKAFLRAL